MPRCTIPCFTLGWFGRGVEILPHMEARQMVGDDKEVVLAVLASVIGAVVVKKVVGERSIDRVVHLYPAVHNRQIGRQKLWGSFQQE